MIYMQIQVGKMLPMGMIDQETVYWQELPKNVGEEHTANVKVILSGCSFDDAIVMGKLSTSSLCYPHFSLDPINHSLCYYQNFIFIYF